MRVRDKAKAKALWRKLLCWLGISHEWVYMRENEFGTYRTCWYCNTHQVYGVYDGWYKQ